jgi:hypothetical protein
MVVIDQSNDNIKDSEQRNNVLGSSQCETKQ